MRNNLNINLESIQNTTQKATDLEQLVINLLQANLVVHIFHLRITGTGSFASHLALNDLYEVFSDYADKLAEQWQGKTMKLLNYPNAMQIEIPEYGNEIPYIEHILSIIEQNISGLDGKDKITSNILQDLGAHIRQQLYKLTFLK